MYCVLTDKCHLGEARIYNYKYIVCSCANIWRSQYSQVQRYVYPFKILFSSDRNVLSRVYSLLF